MHPNIELLSLVGQVSCAFKTLIFQTTMLVGVHT